MGEEAGEVGRVHSTEGRNWVTSMDCVPLSELHSRHFPAAAPATPQALGVSLVVQPTPGGRDEGKRPS